MLHEFGACKHPMIGVGTNAKDVEGNLLPWQLLHLNQSTHTHTHTHEARDRTVAKQAKAKQAHDSEAMIPIARIHCSRLPYAHLQQFWVHV